MNGPVIVERRSDGLVWLEAAGAGWRLAFSTRLGGVSGGAFESLNLGFSTGDAAAAVLANRELLAAAVGIRLSDLVVPGQVHGIRVREVDDGQRGRGATSSDTVLSGTDGLLTHTPGLPLMVSTADCVPVFLAAESSDGRPAIALVHAGWRGMLAGIVRFAADSLSQLGRLTAAVVGPSIGPCCFSVGDDVGSALEARFPGVWRDGRVDLWACAAQELATVGLPAAAVANPRLCTVDDRRFFSHRRDDGHTGRQAALAWITSTSDPPAADRHERPRTEQT